MSPWKIDQNVPSKGELKVDGLTRDQENPISAEEIDLVAAVSVLGVIRSGGRIS